MALKSFILNLAEDYSPKPSLCFLLLRLLTFLSLYQAEKDSEIGAITKPKTCIIIAKVKCNRAKTYFANASPKNYLDLFELLRKAESFKYVVLTH